MKGFKALASCMADYSFGEGSEDLSSWLQFVNSFPTAKAWSVFVRKCEDQFLSSVQEFRKHIPWR
eukprot:10700969-Karenia_brevis.AAC.1